MSNKGPSCEGCVRPDLALGVAGNSQLPLADVGTLPLELLVAGAPLGDACLELAAGDLPYVEGRRLLAGNSEIGEFRSLTVSAYASCGERTTVSASVGAQLLVEGKGLLVAPVGDADLALRLC